MCVPRSGSLEEHMCKLKAEAQEVQMIHHAYAQCFSFLWPAPQSCPNIPAGLSHFPLILYSMLWAYATDCPSSWRSLLLPCLCPHVRSPWPSPPASLICPNSSYSVIKSHITHHLAYRELLNYPQRCFAFFAFLSLFVFSLYSCSILVSICLHTCFHHFC